MSKKPNVKKTKQIMLLLFVISLILVTFTYIFLPQIVSFFIHSRIDLMPLKIYLLVPIFTGLSYYIPSCVFVVFGRNRYVLHSTIFSTISYAIILIVMWLNGWLNSVMNFIVLTVITYFVETLFRLYLSFRIFQDQNPTI